MTVIFGTTNDSKKKDLYNIIEKLNLDIEVLSLNDIGFTDEIEENGATLEENSYIKARAVFDFCQEHDIHYPIITDDSGLFVEALDGRPGIYTARYADQELASNPELPKNYCINKLLGELKDKDNRNAYYECCVTVMATDGSYFQRVGRSHGHIVDEPSGEMKKPYFYTIFILDELNKYFSELTKEEKINTYRYKALTNCFQRINSIN